MVNFALIGCGRISHNHLVAARKNNLNIQAICDIRPDAMMAVTERHGLVGVKHYDNYLEMLSKERLDLIAIATESGKHAAIALDCLKAGTNLIVEKPISLSLPDADKMIELSKENGLVLCPCHQNRFNKSVQKVREAVEEGRFGQMLHGAAHIRWHRDKSYYDQALWRGTWMQDGGVLMNQCIHNIDLLLWMMGGEVDEVFGYTDRLIHPYIETEDLGLALIKFSNGSYGLVEGSTNIFPKNLEETLYLFGSKGTVKVGGKSVNRIQEWHFADEQDDSTTVKELFSEDHLDIYGYGHTPLYTDVVEAISVGREPLISALDGRKAVELVFAIYQSAHNGKPVTYPVDALDSEKFMGRFGDIER